MFTAFTTASSFCSSQESKPLRWTISSTLSAVATLVSLAVATCFYLNVFPIASNYATIAFGVFCLVELADFVCSVVLLGISRKSNGTLADLPAHRDSTYTGDPTDNQEKTQTPDSEKQEDAINDKSTTIPEPYNEGTSSNVTTQPPNKSSPTNSPPQVSDTEQEKTPLSPEEIRNQVRIQASLLIENLLLPEALRGETAEDLQDEDIHIFSKEELNKDFDRVCEIEKDPLKATQRMERMMEALRFHFDADNMYYSLYPLTGIPNYSGNNCFFNVALQVLAHTRMADYPLLRPIGDFDLCERREGNRKRPQLEIKVTEGMTPREKRKAREEAAVKFHEEWDNFCRYNTYPGQKRARQNGVARLIQEPLLEMIDNLRNGRPPSEEEVDSFFILANLPHPRRGGGAVGQILKLIDGCMGHAHGIQNIVYPKEVFAEFAGDFNYFSATITVGNLGHTKIYIRKEDGFYLINDGHCAKQPVPFEEILKNYDNFTPELTYSNLVKPVWICPSKT